MVSQITRLMGLRGGLSGILKSAKGTEIGVDSYYSITVSPFFGEFKTDPIFEHIKALKKVALEYLR